MLKKMMDRIGKMCDAAYAVLKFSLMLSCMLMAAAAAAYAMSGGLTVATYRMYHIARELFSLPASILLVATVSSVCIEDVVCGR